MKHRDGILDLVRGVSALLVMLGHLRASLFLHFCDIEATGLPTKAFYFSTSLGHQAVMVFFVLSGYFVGGSVLSGMEKGSFTWRGYATSRLTRLWMVLIPALLFTLAIDCIGRQWNLGPYAGEMHAMFCSGPYPGQSAAWDASTLLGNLFFLQTVTVPVFGSNGPLWSLANEFWYYLLFPLGGCGLHALLKRGYCLGIALLSGAGLLGWWLPGGMLASGLIWLLGVVVWWVISKAAYTVGQPTTLHILQRLRCWPWRVLGGVLFIGTLAASKTTLWLGSDYVVGTCFALWMLTLTGAWRTTTSAWWTRLVTGLSEISYTLYVVHFPLLFFVAAVVLKGRQFPPDALGYLLFAGLAVAILMTAMGMWWLFERNTDRVKRWVLGRIYGKAPTYPPS